MALLDSCVAAAPPLTLRFWRVRDSGVNRARHTRSTATHPTESAGRGYSASSRQARALAAKSAPPLRRSPNARERRWEREPSRAHTVTRP